MAFGARVSFVAMAMEWDELLLFLTWTNSESLGSTQENWNASITDIFDSLK